VAPRRGGGGSWGASGFDGCAEFDAKSRFLSRLECVAGECFLTVTGISNNLVSRLGLAGLRAAVCGWRLRARDLSFCFVCPVCFGFQNMGLGGLCCEVGCGGLPAVGLQDTRTPPVFNLLRLAEGAKHTLAYIGDLVNRNPMKKQRRRRAFFAG
jgi:hypothetical protein